MGEKPVGQVHGMWSTRPKRKASEILYMGLKEGTLEVEYQIRLTILVHGVGKWAA